MSEKLYKEFEFRYSFGGNKVIRVNASSLSEARLLAKERVSSHFAKVLANVDTYEKDVFEIVKTKVK